MRFSPKHLIALSLGIKANWPGENAVEDPVQEGVFRWICGATYFYAHPEELAGRRTRSASEPIAVFMGCSA